MTVQVDPAASASSAALRMISAQRVMLRRETRDFIATNSYRIAKTIAAKADYEVRVRVPCLFCVHICVERLIG